MQLPRCPSTLRCRPSRSSLRSPRMTETSFDAHVTHVPLGGHVSCSSFDVHVMLAFTVPCAREHLSTLARTTALGSRRRPFLRTSLIASVARSRLALLLAERREARSPSRARIRVRLSTLAAGRTPSAHSPRARELVSRFDGRELRSSFGSRTAALSRTRRSRPCSSFDNHDRVAVRASSR
jgi:hypothetical protein